MESHLGASDIPQPETQRIAGRHQRKIVRFILIVVIGLGMQEAGEYDQTGGNKYSDSHE